MNPLLDGLENSPTMLGHLTPGDNFIDRGIEYPSLSFFPNQKYVTRNLKPEQIQLDTLRQIAKAQARAVNQGIMSEDEAKYFFATQLIEARKLDFGMSDTIRFTPKRNPYAQDAIKMGLEPQHNFWAPNKTDTPLEYSSHRVAGVNYGMPAEDSDSPFHPKYIQHRQENANLAALWFAIKGRGKTREEGAEAWNGKGKVINKATGQVIADSSTHLRKVIEMYNMLHAPINKNIMDTWQQEYQNALTGGRNTPPRLNQPIDLGNKPWKEK